MIIKNKTPQSNIVKAKAKKVKTYNYMSTDDADMLYMHEKGIASLIKEMYETIMGDETIDSILDFLVRKGIPRGSYYVWKAKYPQLNLAHDSFNSIIGNRLFKRVSHEVKTIHTVLPNYDPHVWKPMVEYSSSLKEDNNKNETIVVVKERAPNRSEVPTKDEQ